MCCVWLYRLQLHHLSAVQRPEEPVEECSEHADRQQQLAASVLHLIESNGTGPLGAWSLLYSLTPLATDRLCLGVELQLSHLEVDSCDAWKVGWGY